MVFSYDDCMEVRYRTLPLDEGADKWSVKLHDKFNVALSVGLDNLGSDVGYGWRIVVNDNVAPSAMLEVRAKALDSLKEIFPLQALVLPVSVCRESDAPVVRIRLTRQDRHTENALQPYE